MSNTTAERDISQAYYDADYFVKGNKQIIDPTSGQIKTWGYQGTDWSGHFHIVSGLNHIFNFEPTSMLDIGAGQGSFVDYAIRAGLLSKGYDFSEFAVANPIGFAKNNLFIGDAVAGIPEADASYDVVYCSDMCEHIQKSKIDAVITEFFRITRKWVFLQFPVMEPHETVFDWEVEVQKPEAERHVGWATFMLPLHLNMEHRSWWLAKFEAHGFKVREDLEPLFRAIVPQPVLTNWKNIVVLEKP